MEYPSPGLPMPNFDDRHENQLVTRMAAGDQGALADLYDLCGKPVFSLVLRMVNAVDLAEEITQDVFIKAWTNAHQWNPQRGKVISWLLTIARSTAIDRLRKENRYMSASALGMDEVLNLIPAEQGVGDGLADERRSFQILLALLSHQQREVLLLAFYKGMSHSEIADQLQLPLGTVKTRLRSAMQKLKQLYKQNYEK